MSNRIWLKLISINCTWCLWFKRRESHAKDQFFFKCSWYSTSSSLPIKVQRKKWCNMTSTGNRWLKHIQLWHESKEETTTSGLMNAIRSNYITIKTTIFKQVIELITFFSLFSIEWKGTHTVLFEMLNLRISC